jgi:hypothetical protein
MYGDVAWWVYGVVSSMYLPKMYIVNVCRQGMDFEIHVQSQGLQLEEQSLK